MERHFSNIRDDFSGQNWSMNCRKRFIQSREKMNNMFHLIIAGPSLNATIIAIMRRS